MARNYPADIAAQKSLEERYTKERDAQLSWYLKKKYGNINVNKSKQMDVFRRKLELAPTMNDDLKEKAKKAREQKHIKPKMDANQEVLEAIERLQDKDNQLAVEMRPITPRTKQMLYDGFSREGKGRVQYLKARKAKAPEEKYQFPITSGWEYGWKLGDVIKIEDIKKPEHGRTRLINDTFYTRTGIPEKQSQGILTRSKTVF